MGSSTTARRRSRMAVLLGASLMVPAVIGGVLRPAAAAPTPNSSPYGTSVSISGHGNGHGIGLSQWGAYGYAVDQGWSADQILGHYYGGTTAGSLPDAPIAVRLVAMDGKATTVVTKNGAQAFQGATLLTNGDGSVSAWGTVTVRPTSGGLYDVWGHPARSCVGDADALDPGAGWVQLAAGAAAPIDVKLAGESTSTPRDELVALCESSSSIRSYRGTLRAATGTDGSYHTVNVVPMEQYLRGVVPIEMSASWGSAGGGRGLEALKAQAVAARSYAGREARYSYAKTCDTQACQVYRGAAARSSVTGTLTNVEQTSSDTAVSAMAEVVRRQSNGDLAYTMFSSSSGGYTAPSTSPGFPAVVDEGDSTSANPHHDWTVSVAVPVVESKWPTIGTLTNITVLSRNGLGADGGRVKQLKLTGTAGSVTITGDAFRSALGLKSDWFSVAGDKCSGRVEPTVTMAAATTPTAGFQSVAPSRAIDTRNGIGTSAIELGADCTLAFDPGDAPSGATAVAIVLTVTGATDVGYTTAYPCGTARPTTSATQILAAVDVPGTTVVPLGSDGRICVYSSVTTDVIVDVMGWLAPSGAAFRGTSSLNRLLDTRQPPPKSRVAAGTELRVSVPGTGGATPIAASVNLTATGGRNAGYVSAYPCGSRQETSVLNFRASTDVANHVFVDLDDSGAFCLWASSDVHLIADLDGVFSADPAAAPMYLAPAARAVDTRTGSGGRLAAGARQAYDLGDATNGLLAQVTVISPGNNGYLSVYPCDDPQGETTSVLNAKTGENNANVVLMRTDAEGRLCAYTSMATDIIIDVIGRA